MTKTNKFLAVVFAALLGSYGGAIAADSTVTNLPAASTLGGTELFLGVQSGASVKVTGNQLKTLANTSAVRATTTTSEALANSDQNKLVTFSNAAAVACTIAQAGSGGNFAAGWAVSLKNLGAGTVTCTPTTSTVDGAANFTLTTGQGVDLYSDGTNYFTQPGKGGTTDASLLTSGTLAAARLPAFTGNCVAAVGTGATVCDAPHPGYITNGYYVPVGYGTDQTGTAVAANTIYCTYGFVPRTVTIGTLGVRVATAGSTNVQLAVYANSGGLPGALISNTGNIANTGAATVVSGAMSANKQVGPGGADGGRDLWFCANNGDSTATFNAVQTNSVTGAGYFGTATLANILGASAVSVLGKSCAGANCNGGSSTLGTWPATLAGTTWSDITTGIMPVVFFRVVSSP